ncbi:helix-turn-helix domain-containing protein [Alicyclobacillus fodiniaquatilis]|jgi:AraC-like DNA-binding protein|uniref:Helix-turn-helix domain-containing protein n=1 Tax=Alicyclobacillus fodiniaquatilis TaxID=1661150 RepID=A0ABW4JJ45_9BACL
MPVNYYNIPYELPEPHTFPFTRFLSIWEVEANEDYQCHFTAGLPAPGIFITLEGTGQLWLLDDPQTIHPLTPGSFFIVDQDKPCHYGCVEGSEWRFYFLHFTDLAMPNYLNIPVHQVCATAQIDYLASVCKMLIRTVIDHQVGHMYAVTHLFHSVLVCLAQECSPATIETASSIHKAIHWMHQHLNEPMDIAFLVDLCNISRTQFFRMFKQNTGDTPVRYFYRLKLKSACIALKSTDMTIKQIALSLNYYDEFHFTKSFVREYGVTPSLYRQQGTAKK